VTAEQTVGQMTEHAKNEVLKGITGLDGTDLQAMMSLGKRFLKNKIIKCIEKDGEVGKRRGGGSRQAEQEKKQTEKQTKKTHVN